MGSCCIKCFNDEFLINYIKDNGHIDNCDYCQCIGNYCIDTSNLTELFEPLLDIYEVTTAGEHYIPDEDCCSIDYGDPLNWLIQDEWSIFSDDINDDYQRELLFDVLNSNRDNEDYLDKYELYSMMESNIGYSDSATYWEQFANKLKHLNRFFVQEDWVATLEPFLEEYCETLPEEFVLFRARLGSMCEDEPYPIEEMGAPPSYKSKSGRANPVGISYIYTATNKNTAISEIRPWLGAKVSVAQIKALKDLKIVDLTHIPYFDTPFGYDNLHTEIEGRTLLRELSFILSRPIDPGNSDIDYIPTQYLSELIKFLNYDGIRYKSSLGDGENIVIFRKENLEFTSSNLYVVKEVKVTAELL